MDKRSAKRDDVPKSERTGAAWSKKPVKVDGMTEAETQTNEFGKK
ncbi:hypothetical protein [Paenibacillus sp.]|nr:hypothetical protein [Paenibacillus sp.]